MDQARPATFRSLVSVGEYRTIFTADALSMVGDQVAAVAITVLVYQRSGSPLLAALSYSLAYLPWVLGGPVLAAMADRWPRRRVLTVCTFVQAALIGGAAIPAIPLPAFLFW
jgi:MFS family permease